MEDEINKRYNLEIEVLTPLSIGAGTEKDWVRGVDFVVDKGTLYKLNLKKMVANGIKIDELTGYFTTKDETGIKAKLAGKLADVSDFTMPFPIQSDNDVKTFVKNQLTGNPVMAGSSLKGAIRSVLFQYLGGNSKDGKEVFGSSRDGDEFMRFVKISDAEFDKTELVNTKIFNLRGNGNNWQGGWKFSGSQTDKNFNPNGFNTLYECLMPQQKGYASLMLSKKLYDNYEKNNEKHRTHLKAEKKRPILQDDIQTLFGIINGHTKDYLEKEKDFFTKYATDKSDEIIKSIDELLKAIPSDNSYCILKMSAGSGFHSITGDWQFDDYTKAPLDRKRVREGKVNPKSRKIAIWNGNLTLMGFVKLSAVSDEEIALRRAAEVERIAALKQAEIEAERLRLEAEEQARKEKLEKEARYKRFLEQGEAFMAENRLEDALANYRNAYSTIPSDEIADVIKDVQQRLEAEITNLQIAANQQQEAEQRRLANAIPLAERIANANKQATLFGNVRTWMKSNEITNLSDADKQVLHDKLASLIMAMKPKERSKMKGFSKELDELVGAETAKQWFEEIVSKSN